MKVSRATSMNLFKTMDFLCFFFPKDGAYQERTRNKKPQKTFRPADEVYMHRGGFCRFSMSRYSTDKSNLNDLGSHLTNVAAPWPVRTGWVVDSTMGRNYPSEDVVLGFEFMGDGMV